MEKISMQMFLKFLFCIIILPMMLVSCLLTKQVENISYQDTSYLIKKIKRQNSWYIIYAERKDTLYKIISEINNNVPKNCKKIVKGKKYNLILESMKGKSQMVDGVKIDDVAHNIGYTFDEKTVIYLEPENGISDLFFTKNLNGIYYLKESTTPKK